MATKHDHEIRTPGPAQPASSDPTAPRAAAGPPVADSRVAGPTEGQALIEEARHRQRRRRRWIVGIVLVVLVGAGLGIALGIGTGSRARDVRRTGRANPVMPPSRASAVVLDRPEALAVAADGDVLIANQGTNQILVRTPDGTLRVVAGTGEAGYGGDGGPAVDARLNQPGGIAVAPDGTIYVADTGNNRVRAISPSGTITTVAGNGRPGSDRLSRPVADAVVANPVAVALGGPGRLYVVDTAGLQIIAGGRVSTLVPSGPGRLSIHGDPTAFFPSAVALSRAGDLYVADSSPKLVVAFAPTGQVVDSWPVSVAPAGLAPAPDGSILVADSGFFAVDRIAASRLTPLVRFQPGSVPGLTGTFRPSGVAASGTDHVYTDTDGVSGGTDEAAVAAILPAGVVQVLSRGAGTGR